MSRMDHIAESPAQISPMSDWPDLLQIRRAAELIANDFPPTPSIRWPLLCEATACEVYVKHENHSPLGAFKGRGGLTYFQALLAEHPDTPGVISATRGNHGQSLALAARRYGRRAVILAPQGNSEEKNAAMRALGAELVIFGEDYQSALDEAHRRAELEGLSFVPPFDTRLLAGVATYWLEFFTHHPDLDAVIVPVGMGSGICSALRVRELLGLPTRIYGVVAEQAPAYRQSFEQQQLCPVPARTFLADGLACSTPDPRALAAIRWGCEAVFSVSEAEIAAAMRLYFQTSHNVAEGAAAAALAALMQQRETFSGQRVGLPLTGGNVDMRVFARVLAGETPQS